MIKDFKKWIVLAAMFCPIGVLEAQEVSEVESIASDEVTTEAKVEELASPREATYHYVGHNNPDPFLAPLQSSFETKVKVEDIEIPIVSPLQEHDVKSLRLVGIWNGSESRKAMIMTPRREGVITVVNNPVGNRGGILYAIDEDKVTVREFNFGPDGTREFIDKEIFLEGAEPDEKGVIVIKGSKKPENTPPNGANLSGGNIESPAEGDGSKVPDLNAKEPSAREGLSSPASYNKAFGDPGTPKPSMSIETEQ